MKKIITLLFNFLLIIQQDILSQNYLLPFKGDDLKPGERLYTRDHGTGIQGEGKDFIMKRYLGNNVWTKLLDGKDGTKTTDFIIRERPVYAMADGVITGCWANAPENPRPRLAGEPDTEPQRWLHPKIREDFKEFPRGGNLLWITHADGTKALYAHMIPGTITSNLCANQDILFPTPVGPGGDENIYVNLHADKQVSVVKGQFLGLTGHSGQSSEPHLHIHLEKSGSAEIIRFEKGLSKNYTEGNTPILNDWTSFASQPLPNANVLIRPPRYSNFRIRDFESYVLDGKQIFVGIFEPGDYAAPTLFESNWDKFVKGWEDIESQGNRMIDFEFYIENGIPMYSGIFGKGDYAPISLLRNNWDDFVKGWKDIESQGQRMLDFEFYILGGTKTFVGIFKPGIYAPISLFKNNWDEFMKGWKDIESQGQRMIDFESYVTGGKRVYSGIFKPGNYAPVALIKNDWVDFEKAWKALESQGNRMLDFESYMEGTKRMYVGLFKPGSYAPVAIFNNNWNHFLEAWQNFE